MAKDSLISESVKPVQLVEYEQSVLGRNCGSDEFLDFAVMDCESGDYADDELVCVVVIVWLVFEFIYRRDDGITAEFIELFNAPIN